MDQAKRGSMNNGAAATAGKGLRGMEYTTSIMRITDSSLMDGGSNIILQQPPVMCQCARCVPNVPAMCANVPVLCP